MSDDFEQITDDLDLDPGYDLDRLLSLIAELAQVAFTQARAEENTPRVKAIERAVHQPGTTSIRPAEGDRVEVLMGDPRVLVGTIHLSALLGDDA